MTTRIGFDHYTIAHRGVSAAGSRWISPAGTGSTASSSSTPP